LTQLTPKTSEHKKTVAKTPLPKNSNHTTITKLHQQEQETQHLAMTRLPPSLVAVVAKGVTTTTTTKTTTTTGSAAGRLIQRRATTGSVCSIFYLRSAGADPNQASMAENVFTVTVGVPLACLGLGGLYKMVESGKL
jgi:hypothetical protein